MNKILKYFLFFFLMGALLVTIKNALTTVQIYYSDGIVEEHNQLRMIRQEIEIRNPTTMPKTSLYVYKVYYNYSPKKSLILLKQGTPNIWTTPGDQISPLTNVPPNIYLPNWSPGKST